MSKRTKSYTEDLLTRLKNPRYAAGYLNAILEDDDEGMEERFLIGLRDVAKAHGVTALAQDSNLNRQSLYKALSEDGNPELQTLTALLKAMGLKLAVGIQKKAS